MPEESAILPAEDDRARTNEKLLAEISALKKRIEELEQPASGPIGEAVLYKGLLEAIVEGTTDCVYVKDRDGRYLLLNAEAARVTGRNAADAIGKDDTFLFPPDEAKWIQEHDRAVIESGDPTTYEETVSTTQGEKIVFLSTKGPIFDARGKVTGLFGLARDITERKRAEVEARELLSMAEREKETLSALINSIQDEVWFADREKKFTLANPSALREFGFDASAVGDIDIEELAGSLEVYRPDGSPRPVEEAPPLRAISGQIIRNQEEIVRTPLSGTLRYRQVSSSPVRDRDNTIIGSVSVVRDITEHKRMENDLERTRSVLVEGERIAHVGTFEYVADTEATVWSEEEYRIFGLDPAEPSPPYRLMLAKCIHPDDAALLDRVFTAALKDGSVYEFEHRIVRPDGSVRWVHDRAQPHFDRDGKFVRYIGVTLDITERKLAEKAIEESEKRFRTIFEKAPLGVALIDSRSGAFRLINRKYCDMVGYTVEEMMEKRFQEITHPDDLQADLDNMGRLLAGDIDRFSIEKRYITREGAVCWVALECVPLWEKGDTPHYHIAMVSNITGRRTMEGDLRAKTLKLEKVNTALQVLLEEREGDRKRTEEKIVRNIRELVLPYIDSLQETRLDETQRAYCEILKSNLSNITGSFLQKISENFITLTPMETKVADLIKEGRSMKEIARILGMSISTVNFHRQNLRNKLGIAQSSISLKIKLLSYQ